MLFVSSSLIAPLNLSSTSENLSEYMFFYCIIILYFHNNGILLLTLRYEKTRISKYNVAHYLH